MSTTGFVNGHLEPTVDFDFDEVDERLAGQEPNIPQSAKDTEVVAAARLLHHIVTIGATNPRETMVWINVFLFIMGIHPNQNVSGKEIANGLRLSKEEFFRRVSKMRRILTARGLFIPRIAGQWGDGGRKSVANAAMRSWQKRGGMPMIRVHEADKKLNWIAENIDRIQTEHLTPMARAELKAKLLPVLQIYRSL